MSNKLTYNISFLTLVISTIALAAVKNPAGIGTGTIVLLMLFPYLNGNTLKD